MRTPLDPLIVLVLEDGPALRRRLVDLVAGIAGVDRVIEAGDAPSAVALAADQKPQIALLDIRVPGDDHVRNGLDVLGEIKRTAPATGTIVITNFADERYAQLARHLGADAFLDKSVDFDDLVPTIEGLIASQRPGGAPSVR